MKFLIAPNAFKGSLSASDAAFVMARGVREVMKKAQVVTLPAADGGAGTLDALVESTLGDFLECDCTNAIGEEIIAPYGVLGFDPKRNKTGVVELARTCGLKDIPLRKRNPLVTTSYGAGEQIRAALDEHCVDVIIGLGDTGIHDCGIGIAQALGAKLLDKHGKPVGRGGQALKALHSIELPASPFPADGTLIAACDVHHPLTGRGNAVRAFTPQKGADPSVAALLLDLSEHFCSVVKRDLGKDVARIEHGGSAGGAAAMLHAFYGAQLRPGAELVLEYTRFDELCRTADVVLTGEGTIDKHTAEGKTIAAIARHAKELDVPVIAFGGQVDEDDTALRDKIGLAAMHCITPDDATEETAMRNAREYLLEAVKRVVCEMG